MNRNRRNAPQPQNQESSRFPPRSINLGNRDVQGLFALARWACLALILCGFAYFGSTRISHIDAVTIAENWQKNYAMAFGWWPDGILIRVVRIIHPTALRYMIMPLMAFLAVMVASANFIRDVYALPSIGLAFRYIVSSMFGLMYPRIVIDKGKEPNDPFTVNLLQKIGGPGYAIVEPGSIAIFRYLRGLSRPAIAQSYFMAPFERIALTIDLAEQQKDIEEPIRVITRDGIRVNLKDVHFRYRIRQARNGKTVQRTISDPFPFEDEVLRNIILTLSVERSGLSSWNDSVERPITGEITDFIASHSIDYLTAPKRGTAHPRIELDQRMYSQVNSRLVSSGAELLWVDVGHIDIENDKVDQQRSDAWAADWIGDAKVQMSLSEAVRQGYAELGRAQAQAEIILGIADALHNANLQEQPAINVRQLLLARTAQLLEAISANSIKKIN